MSVERRTLAGGVNIELVDDVVVDITGATDYPHDQNGRIDLQPAPLTEVVPRQRRWSEIVPSVTLVIPTINEAKNLPHVLPKIPSWVSQVIVVDGKSTDNTVEVARQLYPSVDIIHQEGKGKGDAMALGFSKATGDIIVSIDADGSMDPSELIAYVGGLMAGADLVKGSRFAQGGGTSDMELHRKAGNRLLVWATRIMYGEHFSDLCYGYVAFWRDVLDVIEPDADGFEIEAMISARALRGKLLISEVPSFEDRRIHGVSNLRTFRDGWRVLYTLVHERFRKSVQRPAAKTTEPSPQTQLSPER
jgi:glycosyltransferase involved in cell wall biosynthesis